MTATQLTRPFNRRVSSILGQARGATAGGKTSAEVTGAGVGYHHLDGLDRSPSCL